MKHLKRFYWGLAIGTILIAGLSSSVFAQDRERTQDRDLLQLKDQIHKETKLSQQEVDALDPELREYLQFKGRGETVRKMVQAALESGCKGTCLGEMLRTMNRAMSRGLSDKEAREMVSSELRDQARERDQKSLQLSDQELGDRITEPCGGAAYRKGAHAREEHGTGAHERDG